MRIWSLHPEYLDTKGLLALWRETLLAKHVLEGRTKSYKNHPQLERFKQAEKPVDAINQYLAAVYDEALARGYNFDRKKINWEFEPCELTVTEGQLLYEIEHLRNKLRTRDQNKLKDLENRLQFKTHPMFRTSSGEIEKWEIKK